VRGAVTQGMTIINENGHAATNPNQSNAEYYINFESSATIGVALSLLD